MVLDCSMLGAWLIPDEASDQHDQLLQRVQEEGVLVPGLWDVEIANLITMCVRRGRMNAATAEASLAFVDALPARRAADPSRAALHQCAMRHSLTAYDAAYLLVAADNGLALATTDHALIAAAPAAGVLLV